MARQTTSSTKRTGGKGAKNLASDAATANPSGDAEAPAKRRTSPAQFIREVRQETAKITWPTRKETGITTVMVFIMVMLAAVFFFIVDQILGTVIQFVLGLGS